METKNRRTVVQESRELLENTQERIMALLDLTLLDHNLFLYDCGIDFAKELFDTKEEAFDMLITDKVFWSWYRVEWEAAQRKWLSLAATILYPSQGRLLPLYKESMRTKCILSKAIYDSFDTFLKVQLRNA